MNKKTKQVAIFYVDREQAMYYAPALENPIILPFPVEALRNGEILDKQMFRSTIEDLLTTQEIAPVRLLILLDKTITYEKEITNLPLEQEKKEIDSFLEFVPFEHMFYKTFRRKGKTKIIAVNNDICEGILHAFEAKDFPVIGVVAQSVVEEVLGTPEKHFSPKNLFNKIDSFRQYSFVDFPDTQESIITYEKPEISSLRFIILASTFVLLLVIFIAVLFFTFMPTPVHKTKTIVAIPTVTPVATLTPVISPTIQQVNQ